MSFRSQDSTFLPYQGDLDAARRAKDIRAIRALTQYRDRRQGTASPASGSYGILRGPSGEQPVQAPAASGSNLSSLSTRLREISLCSSPDSDPRNFSGMHMSKALGSLSHAAAQGHQPESRPPSPPKRRALPSAHPPALPPGAPPSFRSVSSLFFTPLTSPTASGGEESKPQSPFPFATGAGDLQIDSPNSMASPPLLRHFGNAPSYTSVMYAEREDQVACVDCPQQQQQSRGICDDAEAEFRGYGDGEPAQADTCLDNDGQMRDVKRKMVKRIKELGWGESSAPASSVGPDELSSTSSQDDVEEEVEIEDPILLIRIPLTQTYEVECRCHHVFGLETLYCAMKTACRDDLIPACPLANHPEEEQRCNYLLSQREVEQVLNKYKPPSQMPTEERRLWRFRRGRLIDGSYGWVSERVADAFLRKGKISAGCIECPDGRCGYWVEPTRPLEKQRVDCPKCLNAFCSLCKRPYHYRCSCDEVMTITKQWLEWQQYGREPYLIKMAQEDSSYQQALDTFNDRRSAHQREVRNAEQNWDLLVADENYKSSRCRRCPHCNRVIERIDGCDTMVCGQNAHGGNIQNGCGQNFNWNEALHYHADIGLKKSVVPFAEIPPSEIGRVRHQIMDGQPVTCDICQSKIQGPLAMCINCPTFNCCIRCQNKHTRGHVLRLYMDCPTSRSLRLQRQRRST